MNSKTLLLALISALVSFATVSYAAQCPTSGVINQDCEFTYGYPYRYYFDSLFVNASVVIDYGVYVGTYKLNVTENGNITNYGTLCIGDGCFPPNTKISPNGSACTPSDIGFSLVCSDPAGCSKTYYEIVDSSKTCPSNGYIAGNGDYIVCKLGSKCVKKVCFYSEDKLGNVESVKVSKDFCIDKRSLFSMNVTYHINTTSDPGNASDVVHTTYPIGSSDGDISFFIIPTDGNMTSTFTPGENYTFSINYTVGKKFIIGLTNYSWTGIEKKAYEVSGNKYLIQPFAYPIFSSSNIYVILTRPDVDIVAPRNCGTGERTIFMRNLGKLNGRYRIQITCY